MSSALRLAAGRRAALATPGDYPTGLTMWLKADALALADGAAVTTWADSSAAGNNAAGGTAPTFKTNIAKGGTKPVVRFNTAGSTYMTSSAPTSGAAQTVMAVVKLANTTSYHTIRGANSNGGLEFRADATTTYLTMNSQQVLAVGTGSHPLGTSGFHVVWGTYDGTTWASEVDSTTMDTGSTTLTLAAGLTTVVGRNIGGSTGLDGDLAELATWARILTGPEISALIAGLTAKWGTPLVVVDSFTRADSTTSMGTADTGQAWTYPVDTWGLLGGKAYCPAASSAAAASVNTGVNPATSGGYVEVSAVLSSASNFNGMYPLLFLGATAGNGHTTAWRLYVDGSSSAAVSLQDSGGGNVPVSVSIPSGSRLAIRAYAAVGGNCVVQGLLNGAVVVSTTFPQRTGTYAGIGVGSSTGSAVRFDDFTFTQQ